MTNLLANPEWWFTAVITGLVVNIAAVYLKDWLTSFLSPFSQRYRKFAEAQLEARSKKIESLVENREMLVIEYMRTGFSLFGAVAVLAASSLLPAWTVLQKQFPEIDPLAHIIGWPPQAFLGLPLSIMSLLLGGYGLFLWNAFLNRHKICEKAYAKILLAKEETFQEIPPKPAV